MPLERTVVLLASDHARIDSAGGVGLAVGARLPAPHDLLSPTLRLIVPDALLRAQPVAAKALERNQRKLVSPFDIHATLRHLARLPPAEAAARHRGRRRAARDTTRVTDPAAAPPLAANELEQWQRFRSAFEAHAARDHGEAGAAYGHGPPPRGGPAGRSLLAPLPDDRACSAAGIPEAACRLAGEQVRAPR